ncbi:hypothetical protein NBRC10513_003995 [Rhodotorula toruloides]
MRTRPRRIGTTRRRQHRLLLHGDSFFHFPLFLFRETAAPSSLQGFHVWCWGWDGAGDLEGPDVEPVWEQMPNQTIDPIVVRHDRSFTAT